MHALDELCEILDEELERQENVMAVCRAQRVAAIRGNTAEIERNTEALGVLIREAKASEPARLSAVRQVVEEFALPVEQQTLSGLIGVAPEPWRKRLADFRFRLRRTVWASRQIVQQNARIIRGSLRAVEHCLISLEQGAQMGGGYDDRGGNPSARSGWPVFMDQKG